MVASTLDSILNGVLPIAIIVFFIGLIYMKVKEPIDSFLAWIKSLFMHASENAPTINLPTEIVYR